MSDSERVGARVRAARKLVGRTQRQLAERAHVSLSLVKAVEQGRVPASSGFVTAAARALGATPSQLYGIENQQVAPMDSADSLGLRELGTALRCCCISCMRCAVLAARAGDGGEADGYIEEANAVSAECHPPEMPYYNIDASALNIRVHWCAVPVEYFDGAEAVCRAGRVRVVDQTGPERVAHHHIDMARAWLLNGGREETPRELNTARRTAPNITRVHPQVRETILTLAERDRRRTDSLAGFARWAGINI